MSPRARLSFLVALPLIASAVASSLIAQDRNIELPMIHSGRQSLTRGSESIGFFTPNGPKTETLRPGPRRRLHAVTYDPRSKTWYGQRVGELGVIDERGKFQKVGKPASVRISHAAGLAFDTRRGCVLLASQNGAGTVVWEYNPGRKSWNEIAKLGRAGLRGLAYDPGTRTMYSLEASRRTHAGVDVLRTFNRSGAAVASTQLSKAIPLFQSDGGLLQLVFAGGALWVQTSHYEHPRLPNELRRIDIRSGRVTLAPYNEEARKNIKTWPKWPGGPTHSAPLTVGKAKGRGDYSNYETPKDLQPRHGAELHVLAISSSSTPYATWLKQVKRLGVSTKGGRVTVSIDVSPDKQPQGVVEVVVRPTKRPVTLALVSAQRVVWSIRPERGAKIERVLRFDHPFLGDSHVVGVPAEKVTKGPRVQIARAWELTKSSGRSFDEMIEAIRRAAGKREVSFQGLQTAEQLVVPFRAGHRARPRPR
jgi:hypothetical protein